MIILYSSADSIELDPLAINTNLFLSLPHAIKILTVKKKLHSSSQDEPLQGLDVSHLISSCDENEERRKYCYADQNPNEKRTNSTVETDSVLNKPQPK